MIDIVSQNTSDIGIYDTETARAKNILSVQLGALEYLPLIGIDLKYFLSEDFRFQNESFKSYLVEVLAKSGINVAEVMETVNNLDINYSFSVGSQESTGGLVAR